MGSPSLPCVLVYRESGAWLRQRNLTRSSGEKGFAHVPQVLDNNAFEFKTSVVVKGEKRSPEETAHDAPT